MSTAAADLSRMSMTEALVVLLVEQDDNVDGTTVVHKLRVAKGNLYADSGWTDFEGEYSSDDLDHVLIMASRNGKVDIFSTAWPQEEAR